MMAAPITVSGDAVVPGASSAVGRELTVLILDLNDFYFLFFTHRLKWRLMSKYRLTALPVFSSVPSSRS